MCAKIIANMRVKYYGYYQTILVKCYADGLAGPDDDIMVH